MQHPSRLVMVEPDPWVSERIHATLDFQSA
jgi:hypothetical protein